MFTNNKVRSNYASSITILKGRFEEHAENNLQKARFLEEAKRIRAEILERSGHNQILDKEYKQENYDLYAELSRYLGYVAELDVKNFNIKNELAKIFLGWEVPKNRIMQESFMQEEKHLLLYNNFAGKTTDQLLEQMRSFKDLAQKYNKQVREYSTYSTNFSKEYEKLYPSSKQEIFAQEEDEILPRHKVSEVTGLLGHFSGREINYSKDQGDAFLDELYDSEEGFCYESPLFDRNNQESDQEKAIEPHENISNSWFSYIVDRFLCHKNDRSSVYIY